jgi:putative nucleotidyltransferase with HDIG domain
MAKPLAWFLNAPRRTLAGLLPALARPDDGFALGWLEGPEAGLYLAMDVRDRAHACEVARELLRRDPRARACLVRAALLHDVGKSVRPFRVLERVAAHVLATGDAPPLPRRRGLAGALQVKRHHHRYGAAMIRRAGGSEEVARLVEGHHDGDDPETELLRRIDDAT